MISIIVCSRNEFLGDEFTQTLKNTIGIEHEIIHIVNSDNKYSICEAYNVGITKSKYKYLCLVHDDVRFLSDNWGENIVNHLKAKNIGIIGVAGRDYLTRLPGVWPNRIACANIIQSDNKRLKKPKKRFEPKGFKENKREVIMLDGVFLCMNRNLFDEIKFDVEIPGFHGYDFDICIQSIVSKHKNYVIYDVLLEHASRGNPDKLYYNNLITIFKKWGNQLPLFVNSEKKSTSKKIGKIEKNGLFKLTNKLIRRDFSKTEIEEIIHHFSLQIETSNFNYWIIKIYVKFFYLKPNNHTLKFQTP